MVSVLLAAACRARWLYDLHIEVLRGQTPDASWEPCNLFLASRGTVSWSYAAIRRPGTQFVRATAWEIDLATKSNSYAAVLAVGCLCRLISEWSKQLLLVKVARLSGRVPGWMQPF